ncbi:TSUP family transporter [Staphylococcus hominis]|uniref:TSUP family transporter n=1 Tax=Staphylococcus TaxID=1279 RepID=UPI0008A46AF5|nr:MULTISPECIES: TSUP family transporter [Staphylococcus]MBJ6365598.1 TSUP family transporter [Staphylococcus hominis]MBO0380588.1 TSUP family transporter [Staphylococcus hominis]MCC3738129.1 TSUP family transporter [Staphylococcus hominis]MCI2839544.1 TSUP family transporter [Staphylococcus hominis]MCI2865696.1 TSUP family transporter [Staphylococcus hominis]
MDLMTTLVISFFGFLASFIDAVVGGGGLISIPALMAVGLPPATALGTNKLASSFGSLTAAISFIRAKKVNLKLMAKIFPFVFLASIIGAYIATIIPAQYFKPLAIIMLFIVLIYTLFKKKWNGNTLISETSKLKLFIVFFLLILIGFYDGFLGGGTGSFFIFILLILGLDFLKAAGNAKVLNFGSNIGALLLFILLNKVDYLLGFSMALSMIVGSYIGSSFAVKKGVSYVKLLFIIVTLLLLIKNLYDYIYQ